MANTKRRAEYIDRDGNMFIPMNVEGGVWNEHFITTPKLICIVTIILSLFIIITYLGSIDGTLGSYIIYLGTWFYVSLQVLRFIVFEEKFYYKMYQELKEHEITTPAIFWDIASMKDTEDGAIITYSDARIGIMVKVERDTITGKNNEFKETHYDAISDFYRELATMRYSFVQMNIMEPAGKDPRLNELSKLVYKSDNDNICKLMEMQVGHIKNITRISLYESDYFLFYTHELSKIDNIINDISECIFKLLDGAYIGYTVLSSKDVVDFVKETYGVNYFNSTEASLSMFDRSSAVVYNPFEITGILWNDGEQQEFNAKEKNKLKTITSSIIRETQNQKEVSLKKTLYRKNTKNKIGVDFTQLSNITIDNTKKHKDKNKKNVQSVQPTKSNINLQKDIITDNQNISIDTVNNQHQNTENNQQEEYIDI